MKLSKKGINLIVYLEGGVVTRAYQCPSRIWTIGIGHTSKAGIPNVYKGMEITEEEAIEIFKKDIKKYEDEVYSVLGDVPQNVFDAAVSFHYNTGAISRATWVRKYLEEGKKVNNDIKKHFKEWNRSLGRKLKGLSRRRDIEWKVLDNDVYPSNLITALDNDDYLDDRIDVISEYGSIEGFQKKEGLKEDGKFGISTFSTYRNVKKDINIVNFILYYIVSCISSVPYIKLCNLFLIGSFIIVIPIFALFIVYKFSPDKFRRFSEYMKKPDRKKRFLIISLILFLIINILSFFHLYLW